MKKLLLLAPFLFLLSCSDDSDPELLNGADYYKFTSADKKNLINSSVKKGKTLVYEAPDGTAISYKVDSRSTARLPYGHGTFSGYGLTEYYFDQQRISAVSLDEPLSNGLTINLEKGASTLSATIYFDRWNGTGSSKKFPFLESNTEISMTVGSKKYKRVLVLTSQVPDAIEHELGYSRDINVIYYDVNYGVIGLDDVNGKQFRLKN